MQFIGYTPLPVRWPFTLDVVARGIRIVETPNFQEIDWRTRNLRWREEGALARSHWLRINRTCEAQERIYVLDEMAYTLRTAMLAFQLWAPKGWDGLIILTQPDGRVEDVCIPEAYPDSKWGRIIDVRKLVPTDLALLVEGTLHAFETKIVQVVNPFEFLEIGLQTAMHHQRAGALLWILGLDGLLAAEKQRLFVARLVRLLGKETRVFPRDWIDREPIYTVADVAEKIFAWRGLVAHGKEILKKFREPLQVEFQPDELQNSKIENWTEETLIVESALFCLIASLRKVIQSDLMPLMSNKRRWERWLDVES